MNLRYLMHRYGYITDSDEKREEKEPEYEQGLFGNIYPQFNGDVEGAVEFLKKVKNGECINVLHRNDVAEFKNVSLVWGEEGTEKKAYTDGYGISHIIKAHQDEFKTLSESLKRLIGGDSVAKIISYVFKNGRVIKRDNNRITLQTGDFRMVIKTSYDDIDKVYIHTVYDLRPINIKNSQRELLL